MRVRYVLVVVAIAALLATTLLVGCGKKEDPAVGGPPGLAPGAPGAGGPPGMPAAGGPPGMPGMPGMPGAAAPGMIGGEAAVGADAATLVEEAMEAKEAGKSDEAESKFRDALAADLTNEDAHWGLAWVLAQKGETQKAIVEFEEVLGLTIDPERRSEAQQAIDRLEK